MPGGGCVLIGEPYNRPLRYPAYGDEIADRVLVRYDNWRSTLSGQPECEGMIAVGRPEKFGGLREFMRTARAGLSIQWSAADRIPGQAWTGDEKLYPVEERIGENGPELVQALAVHRVGFFDVYDDPALMYVVADRRGVLVGVWITNRRGGARAALRIAGRIASSFHD